MKKMVLMIMALSFVGVVGASAFDDFVYDSSVREYESFVPDPMEYTKWNNEHYSNEY
jgi:hypothetical protein